MTKSAAQSQISNQDLRKFGYIFGGIIIGLFGLVIPLVFDSLFERPWPWYLGGMVIALALVHPRSLHPLYRAWMTFGELAGWINTRIILFLLFFGLIVPVGLLLRLLGKDPLVRRIDSSVATYRVVPSVRETDHMEKPY